MARKHSAAISERPDKREKKKKMINADDDVTGCYDEYSDLTSTDDVT